jgi:hypothetical protein
MIGEDEVLEHLPNVLSTCADLNIPLTLFEVTFILACQHFSNSKCDAVVLEVIQITLISLSISMAYEWGIFRLDWVVRPMQQIVLRLQ